MHRNCGRTHKTTKIHSNEDKLLYCCNQLNAGQQQHQRTAPPPPAAAAEKTNNKSCRKRKHSKHICVVVIVTHTQSSVRICTAITVTVHVYWISDMVYNSIVGGRTIYRYKRSIHMCIQKHPNKLPDDCCFSQPQVRLQISLHLS